MAEGIDRREFLRGAAGVAVGVAAAQLPASGLATAAGKTVVRPVRGGEFRQGVASGQPSHRAMTLWSKLSEVDNGGSVVLEVAKDRGFDRVVERRKVRSRKRFDHALKTRVHGLDPHEQYFYRSRQGARARRSAGSAPCRLPARARRSRSASSRARTTWPASTRATPGCSPKTTSTWSSASAITSTSASTTSRNARTRREQRRRRGADTPRVPRQVRALSLGQEPPQAPRASPAGRDLGRPRGRGQLLLRESGPRDDRSRVPFEKRKRNGTAPTSSTCRSRRRATGRATASASIARSSWQHTAEILLLDQRQYRDEQPCGDTIPPTPPCTDEDRNDPERTSSAKAR